jgi:hypothetical protein
MLSTAQPTCFLIADISGYTGYLAGVELDHAQDIVADLVGTIVTALRPTFRLAKLEGDAAFIYAPAGKMDETLLLDAIEGPMGCWRPSPEVDRRRGGPPRVPRARSKRSSKR